MTQCHSVHSYVSLSSKIAVLRYSSAWMFLSNVIRRYSSTLLFIELYPRGMFTLLIVNHGVRCVSFIVGNGQVSEVSSNDWRLVTARGGEKTAATTSGFGTTAVERV